MESAHEHHGTVSAYMFTSACSIAPVALRYCLVTPHGVPRRQSITFMPGLGRYSFKTLDVRGPAENGVVEVALNRPDKLNAMNNQFWRDVRDCFRLFDRDSGCVQDVVVCRLLAATTHWGRTLPRSCRVRVVILHQVRCSSHGDGLMKLADMHRL